MIASFLSRFGRRAGGRGKTAAGVAGAALPKTANSMEEIFRGAMVGCAVGDGAGYRLQCGASQEMFLPGDWTDDSSLAFLSAECLAAGGKIDPGCLASLVRSWYRDGFWSSRRSAFDVGQTTRRAVEAFERTGDPLSGPSGDGEAGNGSLTRVGPIALVFRADPARASQEAAISSRVTHGAKASVDSCRLLAHVMSRVASGGSKRSALREGSAAFLGEGQCHADVRSVAQGLGGAVPMNPPSIGSGYAPDTLRMALWSFAAHQGFVDEVMAAVVESDDADSVAAVTGLLSGAYHGFRSVPEEWIPMVPRAEEIISLSDKLTAILI